MIQEHDFFKPKNSRDMNSKRANGSTTRQSNSRVTLPKTSWPSLKCKMMKPPRGVWTDRRTSCLRRSRQRWPGRLPRVVCCPADRAPSNHFESDPSLAAEELDFSTIVTLYNHISMWFPKYCWWGSWRRSISGGHSIVACLSNLRRRKLLTHVSLLICSTLDCCCLTEELGRSFSIAVVAELILLRISEKMKTDKFH